MSKYAIIETGGKQYRVEEKDAIIIERLPDQQAGDSVVFDRVLLVRDGEDIKIGQPFVSGVKVVGTISEEFKGEKLRMIKHKPKKRYLRRKGHRQLYMKAQIEEIKG